MAYEIIIFFMDWNYLLYYIYLDNCVQGLGKRKEENGMDCLVVRIALK